MGNIVALWKHNGARSRNVLDDNLQCFDVVVSMFPREIFRAYGEIRLVFMISWRKLFAGIGKCRVKVLFELNVMALFTNIHWISWRIAAIANSKNFTFMWDLLFEGLPATISNLLALVRRTFLVVHLLYQV